MEKFELNTLSISVYPNSPWKRYSNDIFMVLKATYKNEFLDHINSVDQCIQITVDEKMADGCMSFLDTLVMPQPDGTLTTIMYRKHTHTD